MKKSNVITLIFLCAAIVAAFVFASVSKSHNNENVTESVKATVTENESAAGGKSDVTKDETSEKTEKEESVSESTSRKKEEKKTEKRTEKKTEKRTFKVQNISMSDSLFIGDSRTVGLMEYSKLKDADFFCSVGMSVFNALNQTNSVKGVGKISLTDLLSVKKYKKVYIMLGINEVGYNPQAIVDKYSSIIELIKKNQPDAKIFIEANLHVGKSRSESDKVINNTAINRLNEKLSKLADNKTVFYIDANTWFDDAEGNLPADKSSDSVHLYAKYYAEWGEWIQAETAKYIKEG